MVPFFNFRTLLLGGVFLLYHRLRYRTPYSERAARVAAIVWAIFAFWFAFLALGISLDAIWIASVSTLKVAAVLYSIQFLDTTVFWLIAWPIGFFIVLFI